MNTEIIFTYSKRYELPRGWDEFKFIKYNDGSDVISIGTMGYTTLSELETFFEFFPHYCEREKNKEYRITNTLAYIHDPVDEVIRYSDWGCHPVEFRYGSYFIGALRDFVDSVKKLKDTE